MTKESIKSYSYRISQASRTDLVVIVYDIAIEYLENAAVAFDDGNLTEARKELRMALRCIDQLLVTLEMNSEIAINLHLIYNHIKRTLINAEVSHNTSELARVEKLLAKLRASFYEISRQDESGPLMKNTQQVYAGLTYSNGGYSNENLTDPVENRGFKA
ncbi:MAG: flagellar protein FliS [Lachnospira sp.]